MRDLKNLLVLPTTGFVTCRIWMDISQSRGGRSGVGDRQGSMYCAGEKKKVDSNLGKDRSRFPPSGPPPDICNNPGREEERGRDGLEYIVCTVRHAKQARSSPT